MPMWRAPLGRLLAKRFETLADFRGVSIAAINGFAMGGGLEVALACDIRIAEEQAALALPEARVGLLPCAGGTQRLTQLVGEGWAKRMILCGERIGAEQAAHWVWLRRWCRQVSHSLRQLHWRQKSVINRPPQSPPVSV